MCPTMPFVSVKNGIYELTPEMCVNSSVLQDIDPDPEVPFDFTECSKQEFELVYQYLKMYEGKTPPKIARVHRNDLKDSISIEDYEYLKQFNIQILMKTAEIAGSLGIDGLIELMAYSVAFILRRMKVRDIIHAFRIPNEFDTTNQIYVKTGTIFDCGG
jgi:hypothetical protein